MAAPDFQPQRIRPRSMSRIICAIFDAMRADKIAIQDAAEVMHMSRVGLSYWKSGRRDPSISNVEALAQTLGYRLELVKNDP